MKHFYSLCIVSSLSVLLFACSNPKTAPSRLSVYKTPDRTYHAEAMAASEQIAHASVMQQAKHLCDNQGKSIKILRTKTKHYGGEYRRITKGVLPQSRENEDYRTTINFNCIRTN